MAKAAVARRMSPGRAVWSGVEALHVVQPGDWFSVICLWQQATFAGWHINFQRPLRPSPFGWDTEDLVLDIEVAPDGSWALEDRADFEHAVDGGYFDRETQHARPRITSKPGLDNKEEFDRRVRGGPSAGLRSDRYRAPRQRHHAPTDPVAPLVGDALGPPGTDSAP